MREPFLALWWPGFFDLNKENRCNSASLYASFRALYCLSAVEKASSFSPFLTGLISYSVLLKGVVNSLAFEGSRIGALRRDNDLSGIELSSSCPTEGDLSSLPKLLFYSMSREPNSMLCLLFGIWLPVPTLLELWRGSIKFKVFRKAGLVIYLSNLTCLLFFGRNLTCSDDEDDIVGESIIRVIWCGDTSPKPG